MPGRDSTVLVALAAAFSIAAAVIFAASFSPRTRKSVPELWAIYRSEVVIVGALLIPAVIGGWVFFGALLLFFLRAEVELFRLFGLRALGLPQSATALAGAAAMATSYGADARLLPVVVLAGAGLLLFLAAAVSGRAPRLYAAALSLLVPGLLCVCIVWLRQLEDGFSWIVLVYATVEVNDSFALLTGKLVGKRRVLPRLSPRKTAEGLAAGVIAGAITGLLLSQFLLELPLVLAAPLVFTVLAAGIAGDLITSALKRRRGVKDFSPILSLHGGVLDIYDSFLFAAPAALLLTATLPLA